MTVYSESTSRKKVTDPRGPPSASCSHSNCQIYVDRQDISSTHLQNQHQHLHHQSIYISVIPASQSTYHTPWDISYHSAKTMTVTKSHTNTNRKTKTSENPNSGQFERVESQLDLKPGHFTAIYANISHPGVGHNHSHKLPLCWYFRIGYIWNNGR